MVPPDKDTDCCHAPASSGGKAGSAFSGTGVVEGGAVCGYGTAVPAPGRDRQRSGLKGIPPGYAGKKGGKKRVENIKEAIARIGEFVKELKNEN